MEEITEDKSGDNHDEDEGEIILVLSAILSSSHSNIYPGIEAGYGDHRKDTNDHQAQPVVVVGNVEVICSKFCHINVETSIRIF